LTFERKIYGATRTDGGCWGIKTNQELTNILKGQNIIKFIKKTNTELAGHVERVPEDNLVQKIKRCLNGLSEDPICAGKIAFWKTQGTWMN
jgi:hypothetical protein